MVITVIILIVGIFMSINFLVSSMGMTRPNKNYCLIMAVILLVNSLLLFTNTAVFKAKESIKEESTLIDNHLEEIKVQLIPQVYHSPKAINDKAINEQPEEAVAEQKEFDEPIKVIPVIQESTTKKDRDLYALAYLVYDEARGESFEQQLDVAAVAVNRQKNGGIDGKLKNPSIEDIINERKQYVIGINSNYKWNVDDVDFSNVSENCYKAARMVLSGEYVIPSNVLFQAQFIQGSGVYHQYSNISTNGVTYICYK